MREHDPKKGDSWKVMRNIELQSLLRLEIKEYYRSYIPFELIDIANFCMMIFMNDYDELIRRFEDEMQKKI